MSALNHTLLWTTLCVVGVPLVAHAAGPSSHPFAVEDLVELKRISEPQPSPDGRQVAFVQRTTDLDANKGRTALWRVGIDGSALQQLTFSPESEANPRWAPDGSSLYFLSTRGGSSQVWRLPLQGGEASQVTRLPLDVTSFNLSRDGKRLLVSMDVFPDCKDLACTKQRLEEEGKRKASGKLYKALLFRHWDTWKNGTRSHLFTLSVTGGEPVDVMKGMDADAPTRPWGGAEEYAFTPDGASVVFTAKDEGREEAWSTNYDLFLTKADGSSKPTRLTAANKAWDTAPVFSPDGKSVAYLAMRKPGYEADRFRVVVRAWPGGKDREIAPDWDRSPSTLFWSPDGTKLYATADNLGHHSLFSLDVASGEVREVVKEGHLGGAAVAGTKLVIAMDHLRSPADLHTVNADGTGLTQITRVNAEHLAKVQFGEPEQFSFVGANGDQVYAWLVKPVGFKPGKKYPVAMLIHGGPQGSFGNNFHYRWNPQTYAGAGYAALMIDFHGSTGYGQAFTDAINGAWGGKPLEDLQKGLEAALARYPFLDGHRVAALGASYGAYMINWIAGAWPDRFRCLVSHDGNLDERFAYYDTEELWFPEHEHGTPWDNPEAYEKHNPINLVKNWKTPILVVHGGQDFRVVETQGMATFTAAQRRGVPSEFLYFPDENHWVLKPHNSIQWHKTVLGWLDRWTK